MRLHLFKKKTVVEKVFIVEGVMNDFVTKVHQTTSERGQNPFIDDP